MNKDQERAWKASEKEAAGARKTLLQETASDVIAALKRARENIIQILAGAPSDYQTWHLTELQKEIDRVLSSFSNSAGQTVSAAASKGWTVAAESIDRAISVSGISAVMPRIDSGQLMGISSFMVERIKDVSTVTASKMRLEVGLTMIGSQSINDTIDRVAQIMDTTDVARVKTIVGTGLSSVWSVARDTRSMQSEEVGVEMEKIWRRSGKIHSRLTHDLADGQRVPAADNFNIGGVSMRHPHDPAAPAKEIINCGCIALYRPKGVRSALADKRPFTAQEIALNPYKAEISDAVTK